MQVGGKLAQVGSRLIGGTAKRLANEFFGAFSAFVENENAADGPPGAAPLAAEARPSPPRRRLALVGRRRRGGCRRPHVPRALIPAGDAGAARSTASLPVLIRLYPTRRAERRRIAGATRANLCH